MYKVNLESIPKQFHTVTPDYVADTIFDVRFSRIGSITVNAALFDLDSTLRTLNSSEPSDTVIQHLEQHVAPFVRKIGIITTNPRDLGSTASALGINKDYITQPFDEAGKHISKPNIRMFQRAAENINEEPENIVMIGDKLFNDILGANRAGMHTVWLKKQLGRDRLIDQLTMRPLEKVLCARYFKKQ